MATMEAASEQSAKLSSGGSTPPVASLDTVWVFNRTGEFEFFPSAVFSNRRLAEEWILKTRAIGVLTRYFLNKPDNQDFPEHYHYEEERDYLWLEKRLSGETENAPGLNPDADRYEGSTPS